MLKDLQMELDVINILNRLLPDFINFKSPFHLADLKAPHKTQTTTLLRKVKENVIKV